MLLLLLDLETIETAQEIVESDSSDDEWNYRKVEDNKEVDSVQTIEEHTEFSHQVQQEETVESSIVEEEKLVEEEEEETAPIEVADHIEQLEENVSLFKFMIQFCDNKHFLEKIAQKFLNFCKMRTFILDYFHSTGRLSSQNEDSSQFCYL